MYGVTRRINFLEMFNFVHETTVHNCDVGNRQGITLELTFAVQFNIDALIWV